MVHTPQKKKKATKIDVQLSNTQELQVFKLVRKLRFKEQSFISEKTKVVPHYLICRWE